VYACAIPPKAYFERIKGGGYDRSEYYASPDLYHSTFSEKIAPYLTTLIHGAGWSSGYPRIMTNAETDHLISAQGGNGKQKLAAVQDVTCDLEVSYATGDPADKQGALEFMNKATSIDEPCFTGPGGILVGSTDILPTELRELL
jgi:alpha-aminoadipic semialdehyde synthase